MRILLITRHHQNRDREIAHLLRAYIPLSWLSCQHKKTSFYRNSNYGRATEQVKFHNNVINRHHPPRIISKKIMSENNVRLFI